MRGAKQDLAWVRNDAHIDELCRAMKLNAVACDDAQTIRKIQGIWQIRCRRM